MSFAGATSRSREPSKGETEMTSITHVGRVMVPVADQDAAIAFYTGTLDFELVADVPFGDGERWVEVAPVGGGASLALVPSREHYEVGRSTGIALESADARAAHADLLAKGVDVDAELMGGDGTVPRMFFFRDHDANTLMIVESM
jgi:catechol 2,3-dioxygenase-like lactoylglutathione lyase family enzyme